jgi:hypothetical protein
MKGCPGNVKPNLGESEEANCRVLPLCSSAGADRDNCFAGEVATDPTTGSLVNLLKEGGEEEKAFEYPKSNGFDLPALPECTGLNAFDTSRKVECRQIGRYTETGNWFVQMNGDGEEKKDGAPDYNKLTNGTPQLPECTGMNGDRKGTGTDCRQIGRYNGPWPVTDDVQLKQIGLIQ